MTMARHKTAISVTLEEDVATFFSGKKNRSAAINHVLKQHLRRRLGDRPELELSGIQHLKKAYSKYCRTEPSDGIFMQVLGTLIEIAQGKDSHPMEESE